MFPELENVVERALENTWLVQSDLDDPEDTCLFSYNELLNAQKNGIFAGHHPAGNVSTT